MVVVVVVVAVVAVTIIIILVVAVFVVVVAFGVDSTWQRKLKELVAVNGAKIECYALAFAVREGNKLKSWI